MKGLLLKDLLNLKQQARVYLLVVLIWMALGLLNRDTAIIGGVTMILAPMLPVAAVAHDERAKWEGFAVTMPVTRRQLVLSKYILCFLGVILGALFLSLFGFVVKTPADELAILVAVFSGLGLVICAVSLPIVFQLGTEKGRLVILAVVLVPTMLSTLLSRVQLPELSESVWQWASRLAPLFVAALVWLSIEISCQIYRRKEF